MKTDQDNYFVDRKLLAYFDGKVCWYRPDVTEGERTKVYMEARKRGCTLIHKKPDIDEFEKREAGTKKLGDKIAGELIKDPIKRPGDEGTAEPKPEIALAKSLKGDGADLSSEISEIAKDVEATAFSYCKKLVPLLESTVKYVHIRDGHEGNYRQCKDDVCAMACNVFFHIDRNLFHGTLEDLTGIKP